jgi:hypothetical protein
LWTHLYLNGFDTTNFSVDGVSVGTSLSEDKLKESIRSIQENSLFYIFPMYYDSKIGDYQQQKELSLMISKDLEDALCVFTDENTSYTQINKEVLLNLFYFAMRTNSKKMCFLLTRKNKDYVKILQGIMTVGFKPSNSRYSNNGTDYKVMTMEINKKFDEVQEIDF